MDQIHGRQLVKWRVQYLDLAVEQYVYTLDMTLLTIGQARNRVPATENVTAQVAEVMARHLGILDTLYDTVPDIAKAAIAQARETSEAGRQNALKALARKNHVLAAEMNLAAMEERLNRVRVSIEAREALQIALQQFKGMARFGRKISQIAEETGSNITEVAQLMAEATSIHLGVLMELYEEVPEEAREAVRQAMEESFRGYERIKNMLMSDGVGDSGFPVIPEVTRQRMKAILGWANATQPDIPTGRLPRQVCPSCVRR